MPHLFRSFYGQLSVLFLVLILALGVALAVVCANALMGFVDETEQKLNRNLAQEMAVEFQPLLIDMIDEVGIREKIEYMTGINRRIEIYLLGSNGMIKGAFLPGNQQNVAQETVDVEALDTYLQQAETLPILGPDPRQAGRLKPFSVAPIEIMGETGCYLYIILGGQQYDSVASMVKNSTIVRTTLRGLLIAVLFTGILGLFLFALLTRRLRAMKTVVGAFQKGQFNRRVEVNSSDEIGQLGASFNQMADTIVANMDELKRTDQLRRELIANVSHDLRSPLASIQGYLETILIKEPTLSPKERRKYMEIGLKNTQRLNRLVGELFDLSKLDAQQVKPEFEAFSIAELVQDLALQFKPEAEAVGVHLEADLPDHLSLVYADIALVERVISNLIDNALRHTPAGGTVRVVPSNAGESVSVRVIDTGHGIPAEDLPHIFDRFYRVEKSRTNARHGAGLGLAIARKIVELHGSTLSVSSKVNKGSTFAFSLPTWNASFAGQQSLQFA